MQSISKARTTVEPILRNKRKAEQIKQKIGKISSLEAVAAAVNQPIQSADSIRFNGANPTLGYESRVIGAIFNTNNNGKVVPEAIEGQSGVYVVRVNNVGTAPVLNANLEEQRRAMAQQARQAMMYRSPIEALKTTADITDNRSKFF
jgi:peptidyl-prolyl cis-trans isomerase D